MVASFKLCWKVILGLVIVLLLIAGLIWAYQNLAAAPLSQEEIWERHQNRLSWGVRGEDEVILTNPDMAAPTSDAWPTCNSSIEGKIWRLPATPYTPDPIVCLRFGKSYNWAPLFGVEP